MFELRQAVECPKCGKHSFVQTNEKVYQCLSCDHVKDLAQAKSEDSGELGNFLVLLMSGFLLLLLL